MVSGEILLEEHFGDQTIKYEQRNNKIEIIESRKVYFSITAILSAIFLPQGYPDSVSSDYLEYQVWDTCQAFCSTITGTLCMKAVLEGVGVGNDNATPLAAAVTWIIKDGSGMIGRIIFAWWKGQELDSNCKRWRLFADFLNDLAFGIELYIPYFISYSMWLLSLSTLMKSLVGVAGGATRAALTSHQAIRGNMADVSAKDSSQETLVNLCASCIGIFLLQSVEGYDVRCLFITLATLHLYFNYKAVKCLKMEKFNEARYLLTLHEYFKTSQVLKPDIINKLEPVLPFSDVTPQQICGVTVSIGKSLKRFIGRKTLNSNLLTNLHETFKNKNYLIEEDEASNEVLVCISSEATDKDVLEAYFRCLLAKFVSKQLMEHESNTALEDDSPISRVCQKVTSTGLSTLMLHSKIDEEEFQLFMKKCQLAGWNTSAHQLQVDEWRFTWANKKTM